MGTPDELKALGFGRPQIVVINGMVKKNAELFTDAEHKKKRPIPRRRLSQLHPTTGRRLASARGEDAAREPLDASPLLSRYRLWRTAPQNDETPENTGVLKYRYRDSKPASEE